MKDGFNRPDNAALGNANTGQAWQVTTSVFSIKDNMARLTGDGLRDSAVINSGWSDGQVSVTLIGNASPFGQRLLFRYTNNNNHFLFAASSTSYTINKLEAAGSTILGTYTTTPASGDVLSVIMRGSTIIGMVNGVVVITTTNTFNQTATLHGFGGNSVAGTIQDFDNFLLEGIS